MKHYISPILFAAFALLLIAGGTVYAGEYTNSFRIKITEEDAVGESLKEDPVEAFNNAVEAAMKTGQSLGESELIGASRTKDFVLQDSWVKKEAHLQVTDLQVKKYRFWRPPGEPIRVSMNVDMQVDYIDVPKFTEDYEKTITGATYRSMAVPGWGQIYNRQYTTSILYGTAFWTFYVMFIQAAKNANSPDDLTNAALNFQIPALILWSFNVSEAATSRIMGRRGLENLRQAYRMDVQHEYVPLTERGIKFDFVLFTCSFGGGFSCGM
ncbi:DUF5683 domain-containing protein [Turneriella parva]|uniref:DUF5683 domain-containing protein n=1 Tax=Turneriella parva (strain ATCC BAA-1111 / DSM 21527 / NCTC 11395 / H) TaxID=869212 RepID=I4BBX2_TURPD|nr:DUF5683 domain-containing protein [Turneriella parva]AFM14779.1 hypothetical protein Turpa_4146 [Turneriella parva DSM 21527]